MKTQLIQFVLSLYLINRVQSAPKTSAETGNDIEKFLLEGNSVKELSPKPTAEIGKKPDKFMEDLIEVQRTYRSLKEKWHRMMDEKNKVLKAASSTTPAPPSTSATSMTTSTSSEIQEIDVDVFEAPDKFQDISQNSEASEFDDENFVDISMTSSTPEPTSLMTSAPTVPPTTTVILATVPPTTTVPATTVSPKSQLAEIQNAIRDAFKSPPSLFEILGPTTRTTVTHEYQRDATVTTLKIDDATPLPRNQQIPELTMLNVPRPRPRNFSNSQIVNGPTLLSQSQIQPGPNDGAMDLGHAHFGATVVPVATPWRKPQMEQEEMERDPFEMPTTNSESPTTPESPTTSPESPLPQHILPTSSFHSSGSHPDSQPATNLFRYPDQVQIPFFGAKKNLKNSENSESLTTSGPVRPTTPEPFRSEEIQNLEDVENQNQNSNSESLNLNSEDVMSPDDKEEEKEEVVASDSDGSEDVATSDDIENPEDIEESEFQDDEESEDVTASEDMVTPSGIENNMDYVEETFSKELVTTSSEAPDSQNLTSSDSQVPESFGIQKSSESILTSSESEKSNIFGSPPGSSAHNRPRAFGSVPSSSGPQDSGDFGIFRGSPPGSFGSKRGPEAPPTFGIGSAPLPPSGELVGPPGSGSVSTRPSGPLGSFDSGSAPLGLLELSDFGPAHFGIGRSPPGFSEPIGPTLPPSTRPEKPGIPYPTLVDQIETFFADDGEKSVEDTGASSALGSFGSSAEVVKNIPVSKNIEVLEDPTVPTVPHGRSKYLILENTTVPPVKPKVVPVHMPTSKVGIFGTKLQTINQRAYKPPMFPSALSSETVKMMPLGNPYLQRTTVQPIGPHGLTEPKMEVNSVDMELPAWGDGGMEKDRGIMNKARREYQKEFEQQIRDVKMIDEEINKISKMNDDGRSKSAQRCSQVYAHTLSLPQIQKMSLSLGLGDVATVIQKASDLVEHQENDIAQLELDLEEKRKLIAKIEILLSLSESRALLFDLLNEQKKIAEKMENHALDLLQKNNFRPHTPSPFSAASDLSELSSAVRQVLNQKSITLKKGPGWSMMKRKLHKKSKIPKKNFEIISPSDVVIRNNFIDFNKKTGHLQETAEIVEPVLTVPFVAKIDKFGRQPVAVAVHRRPLPIVPLAPPTMRPTILVRQPRPSQLAAMHLPVRRPLAAPESQNSESETVHELIDMLHEDIVKLPAEEEEKICKNVQCDFEKADLCNYESSHDETTRFRFSKSRNLQIRQKRESQFSDDLLAEPSNIADDLLPYTFRAWSIWAGRRAERQKQIDIGPTYSSRNLHFAAVFLEPQQAGILSIPLILSPTSTKIRLRIFEGTRGLRLRICCDRYCPLETEQGLYRGHRSWLRKTVTCPANTQTLSFECLNDGPDRGACGVDDIFVDSNRCQKFFKGADQS